MEDYLRYAALVMIAVILSLVIGRRSMDMSLLLTLAVCVLVSIGALGYLEPVMELVRSLRRLGKLDSEAVSILLRSAGIGLVAELAAVICSEAGEAALGKALQLLANAVILWLSLPLFQQILTMIEEVLA